MVMAIATHANATYGDSRSPTREHGQPCYMVETKGAHPRLTYTCGHPEHTKEPAYVKGRAQELQHECFESRWMDMNAPFLVPVYQAGRYRAHVRACADEQKYDEKEGLEVE